MNPSNCRNWYCAPKTPIRHFTLEYYLLYSGAHNPIGKIYSTYFYMHMLVEQVTTPVTPNPYSLGIWAQGREGIPNIGIPSPYSRIPM